MTLLKAKKEDLERATVSSQNSVPPRDFALIINRDKIDVASITYCATGLLSSFASRHRCQNN